MKNLMTLLFIATIFSLSNSSYSQSSPEGNWQGNIEIMGLDLEIFVTLTETESGFTGTIDIPQQNARGIELSEIIYDFPEITFALEVPGAKAVFKGDYKDPVIEGDFEQSGMKGKFSLNRIDNILHEETEEVPEHVGLKPYTEEEVIFFNGELKFTGTLSIPLTDGKHPAVVLISGSGPQDRDENIGGFKIFGIIADHLTSNGIAVLRYDDRGVGGSDGNVNDATTSDFADDVASAVEFLRTRQEIDNSKIGLLGHSEGGIVAPIVASRDKDISFIILMAGTGVTGRDVILEQSKLIALANGIPTEKVDKDNARMIELFDVMKSDENRERFEELIYEMSLESYQELDEEHKESIIDSMEYIGTIKNMILESFDNNWFRYFIDYDPAVVLEKVKCDVLILFGGLDLQVARLQNEEPMMSALQRGGNGNYTVVTFEKANHLFQEAKTGSPFEYATLPYEFIDGFLDTITNWILDIVQ